ncbi:hypothetical protein [Mycobacteroides abscessus]|uniref:hypothetical protein n=1 Tax=Mycobacteroides abscessus TaxID=36809 RepID=UPI0009A7AF1D|nr:hypothetical protein [Mycobacteroides abscessus]SKQ73142.1 Uncharacterised protein [Mycobacteroides abscessus subsp. massiliense]
MIARISYPGSQGKVEVDDIAKLAYSIAMSDGVLANAYRDGHDSGPSSVIIPREGRMDSIRLALFNVDHRDDISRESLMDTMKWLQDNAYIEPKASAAAYAERMKPIWDVLNAKWNATLVWPAGHPNA